MPIIEWFIFFKKLIIFSEILHKRIFMGANMKKIAIFTSLLILSFLFAGCFNDLGIPQKVDIRTTAEYNFTICNIDKDFTENFSITNLITNAATGNFQVYDYNPGENQEKQMYLLKVPIQEIPIDFASYLEDSAIGEALDDMSFEQEIEIPSLAIDKNQPVDIQCVNDALLESFSFTGSTSIGLQKINFGAGTGDVSFNNVRFISGKIIVEAPSATGRVALYTGPSETAAKENKIGEGTLVNGKVTFNVNNKSVYSDYSYIYFIDDDTGASFLGYLDENSVFDKANGITTSIPIEVPEINQTFDIGTDDSSLESVIFGTNSYFNIEILTPGWSGITETINCDLDGGFDFNINSSVTDLNGKEFTNQDIEAKMNIQLSFTNAVLDFAKTPSVKISTTVGQIQSVTAALPSGVNTNISENKQLSSEAQTMLKEIVWKSGCGIKIKYTNTFPEGNNFELKNVNSNFLGLTGTTDQLLLGNTTNGIVNFLTSSETTTDITTNHNIDFNAELGLPGGVPGKITAVNVSPGTKYKIRLAITPVFDWKTVTLDRDAVSTADSVEMDFNLGSMLSSFDDALGLSGSNSFSQSIEFKNLPIRLYCQMPAISGLGNPQFNGKIKVCLKNSSEIPGTGHYILGTDSTDAVMPMSTVPELQKNSKDTVINTISGGLYDNLADLMNHSSSNPGSKLSIDYDISLSSGETGELTIDHDSMRSGSPGSITICAIIILPLDFKLKNDINIDIIDMLGKDTSNPNWDLFNRSGPTDTSDFQEYLDAVEYVKISYKPTKKPFISSKAIKIEFDLDGSGTNFTEKELSLNGGEYKENPSSLLSTYPLQSTLNIKLQGGDDSEFAIPRTMALKTFINLGIKSNGNPITVFGD